MAEKLIVQGLTVRDTDERDLGQIAEDFRARCVSAIEKAGGVGPATDANVLHQVLAAADALSSRIRGLSSGAPAVEPASAEPRRRKPLPRLLDVGQED
jgi:hypothetical protein